MTNRRYTKNDVETHSASYYAPYYPAVNVKVRNFPTYKIQDHYNLTDEQAEELCNIAFEAAQEFFWYDIAPMIADDKFDDNVKIYSAGRSSGWLIVDGLPPIESWDAVILAKWRSFENAIKAEVKFRTSAETLIDDIDANGWINLVKDADAVLEGDCNE